MALLQLAATGPQDMRLTSEPQFSLFKSRHKRHTPFAVEWTEEAFQNEAKLGQRCTLELGQSSDLVKNIVVEATMKKVGDTFYPMEELLQSVELWIGGNKIAEYDSTWIRIFDEMYRTTMEEQLAYREMTGFTNEPVYNTKTLRIPLLFWFCRSTAQALPLIALSYSPVEIVFHFASSIRGIDTTLDPMIKAYVERIYLGNEERTQFAKAKHSYLIERVQMHTTSTLHVHAPGSKQNLQIDLPLNHPTKSLVFVFVYPEKHGVFASSLVPFENRECFGVLRSATLLVNGQERQEEKSGSWLRNVENYLRLGSTPSVGVYAMHFCMKPHDPLQPSGSLNMSQLDGKLLLTLKKTDAPTPDAITNVEEETVDDAKQLNYVHIYGVHWNELNIQKGMAGLRWSN
jgi:hypothetical protein